MRAMGKNPTEDELLNLLMEADVDGNGTIDFSEFVEMMRQKASQDAEESVIDLRQKQRLVCITDSDSSEAFKIFDRDKDGFIRRQDLKSVTLTLGLMLTEDEVDAFMGEADKVLLN